MCLNLYTATGFFLCVLVCYALYRVMNMCYLSVCYMFRSDRGCVAFCVWLLENYFHRVLVDGSLFISRCCNFFSAKDGCGQGKLLCIIVV